MTTVIAVPGKAIVTLKPADEVTSFGLIIPESHREASTKAIVVASKIDGVEVGDTVLLSGAYAGASFTVDEVEYITVVQDEILAVL